MIDSVNVLLPKTARSHIVHPMAPLSVDVDVAAGLNMYSLSRPKLDFRVPCNPMINGGLFNSPDDSAFYASTSARASWTFNAERIQARKKEQTEQSIREI